MNKPIFVSVIMPVLNAERYISQSLDALVAQDYPHERFEIIVLDNGSCDKTTAIARRYPVKLIVQQGHSISALRNLGARHAKGQVFAFIDADCVAPKNWLSQAVNFLHIPKAGAAGCWYALPERTTLLERTWDILTYARRERVGSIDWVPSGNLIVHKETFEEVHGFDEYLITCEDVDICHRITATGKVIYSHPKIAVTHLGNPKTWKQFFLKEKWRGEGVLQNAFRSFPRIQFNKALLFAAISVVSLAGILGGLCWWLICGQKQLLVVSFIGLLIVPLAMTVKLLLQRPEWDKFFVLLPLFTIYGLARGWSLSSRHLWKHP